METQTTTVEKKQQKQFSSIEKYVFSISFINRQQLQQQQKKSTASLFVDFVDAHIQ